MQTWRSAQRRIKQIVAGIIFVGLLLGAGGTVFTVFADVVSHLGQPSETSPTSVIVQSGNAGGIPSVQGSVNTAPATSSSITSSTPGSSSSVPPFQAPVMEYSNTPVASGDNTSVASASVASGNAPNPEDGVNSALAAAMDTSGVYIGERVQHVFGSMLKGVLNTLFINTN